MKTVKPSVASKFFMWLDIIDEGHFVGIKNLEQDLKRETGIKDIEFVWVDGAVVGIGTPMRKKKMPLIHRS